MTLAPLARVPPRAISVAVLILLVVAWWAVTQVGIVSRLFLPSPGDTWAALADLLARGYNGVSLQQHAATSFILIFAGAGTGILAGILLGLAMGFSGTIAALASPIVEFFRPLPQLSYLVLLIVWLGIDQTAQIVLLFLAALPLAAVATRDGVRSASLQVLHVAQSLGASRLQLVRHVILPSALPEIFSGARIAVGVVYSTLVAAEMIAGTSGLGWVILDAGRELETAYVFVGILMLGVAGLLLNAVLLRMEFRIVHWAGRH